MGALFLHRLRRRDQRRKGERERASERVFVFVYSYTKELRSGRHVFFSFFRLFGCKKESDHTTCFSSEQ